MIGVMMTTMIPQHAKPSNALVAYTKSGLHGKIAYQRNRLQQQFPFPRERYQMSARSRVNGAITTNLHHDHFHYITTIEGHTRGKTVAAAKHETALASFFPEQEGN